MGYSYVLGYNDAPKGTIFRHRTIAGQNLACVDEHGKQPGDYWVRVTSEFEIATLAELKVRVKQDTGKVPGWLEDCPPEEYIGVEHEYQINGRWFTACIEGSEHPDPYSGGRRATAGTELNWRQDIRQQGEVTDATDSSLGSANRTGPFPAKWCHAEGLASGGGLPRRASVHRAVE